MDSLSTRVAISATILGISAVATIVLGLCLAHTWKYWRQVRIYVVLVLVGNVLEVAVTQGIMLSNLHQNTEIYASSLGTCRFFMFLAGLSGNLSAYAVAALGLHVLLTSITGNQGNLLRHALVLGLMALLSLPMPLVKMVFSKVITIDDFEGSELRYCTYGSVSTKHLAIGEAVTMLFPFGVNLLCSLAATVLFFNTNRGTVKGDEDKSDLILAYLMGAALLIFYAPAVIFGLVMNHYSEHTLFVFLALHYVMTCFPFVTAVIIIVFAYAHVYRNRGEMVATTAPSGERQRLVN